MSRGTHDSIADDPTAMLAGLVAIAQGKKAKRVLKMLESLQ